MGYIIKHTFKFFAVSVEIGSLIIGIGFNNCSIFFKTSMKVIKTVVIFQYQDTLL